MNTVKPTEEEIAEFAMGDEPEHFVGVEYAGVWKGYDVYYPVYDIVRIVGQPLAVLVSDDGMRWTLDETMEVLEAMIALHPEWDRDRATHIDVTGRAYTPSLMK